MDTALTVNVVTELLFPVFKRYNVRKAILFGSVAKGTNQNNSDLDIVVDSNLKGLRFIGLLEDLQQAVDREIDLLDVAHIEENSPVEDEIKKTGVVIYEE
ncbi:MAG: nucleotidyltransferase domain-containing protein [Lachnospiraceae bacterium]|nr:nucleotidyltransferase domain-containing protein [Lachnospiraceae bacterium]